MVVETCSFAAVEVMHDDFSALVLTMFASQQVTTNLSRCVYVEVTSWRRRWIQVDNKSNIKSTA